MTDPDTCDRDFYVMSEAHGFVYNASQFPRVVADWLKMMACQKKIWHVEGQNKIKYRETQTDKTGYITLTTDYNKYNEYLSGMNVLGSDQIAG